MTEIIKSLSIAIFAGAKAKGYETYSKQFATQPSVTDAAIQTTIRQFSEATDEVLKIEPKKK
jgi:hypothetical protein